MSEGIGALFVLGFFLALYFFPSFCASGKRQALPVFVLNLFLGWTLIGWVGALVWAAVDDSPRYGALR